MNLEFKGQKLEGSKSGVEIDQKNCDDRGHVETLGINFINQDAPMVIEQAFKDIDYYFGMILEQCEHRWRKESGFKWRRDKKKKFDHDLEIQTGLIKKVVYNIIADWEQEAMMRLGKDWYPTPENLNDQQPTACDACNRDHYADFDYLSNLIYDDKKIEELKKIYEKQFEEAKRGNDLGGQPFTHETYFKFLAIQNGINQDLQDLFSFLEKDRLNILLRLAAKQIQGIDTEEEDLRLLRILNSESLILRFIYTIQDRLNKINESTMLKDPDSQNLFTRDQILFDQKSRIMKQITEMAAQNPGSESLQCLSHNLLTWREIQDRKVGETTIRKEALVRNHTEETVVVHYVPAEGEMITGKHDAQPAAGPLAGGGVFSFGEMSGSAFAVNWGFPQETGFDYQAVGEPQAVVNNNHVTTKIVPVVGAIGPESRPGVVLNSEPAVVDDGVAFSFGELAPTAFATKWGFAEEAAPLAASRTKSFQTEWGFEDFVDHSDRTPSGSHPAGGTGQLANPNRPTDHPFAFGSLQPATLNIDWGFDGGDHEAVQSPHGGAPDWNFVAPETRTQATQDFTPAGDESFTFGDVHSPHMTTNWDFPDHAQSAPSRRGTEGGAIRTPGSEFTTPDQGVATSPRTNLTDFTLGSDVHQLPLRTNWGFNEEFGGPLPSVTPVPSTLHTEWRFGEMGVPHRAHDRARVSPFSGAQTAFPLGDLPASSFATVWGEFKSQPSRSPLPRVVEKIPYAGPVAKIAAYPATPFGGEEREHAAVSTPHQVQRVSHRQSHDGVRDFIIGALPRSNFNTNWGFSPVKTAVTSFPNRVEMGGMEDAHTTGAIESAAFAFGDLPASAYRQDWGKFYRHPFAAEENKPDRDLAHDRQTIPSGTENGSQGAVDRDFTFGKMEPHAHAENWGRFYAHPFPGADEGSSPEDSSPFASHPAGATEAPGHDEEGGTDFAFGEIQPSPYNQDWGSFYRHAHPAVGNNHPHRGHHHGSGSERLPISHHNMKDEEIHHSENRGAARYPQHIGHPHGEPFQFGHLERSTFDQDWGEFYAHPFAGGELPAGDNHCVGRVHQEMVDTARRAQPSQYPPRDGRGEPHDLTTGESFPTLSGLDKTEQAIQEHHRNRPEFGGEAGGFTFGKMDAQPFEQDWGTFYAYPFTPHVVNDDKDLAPSPARTPEPVGYTFGHLDAAEYNQKWGTFYRQEFPGDRKDTNPSRHNDAAVGGVTPSRATRPEVAAPLEFHFDRLPDPAFGVSWGYFYHQPFAAGAEYEVARPKRIEHLHPVTGERYQPEKRKQTTNPIDLIEEIVQEFAEPLPVAEEQAPEARLHAQAVIAEEPEEIRLRRLKLKKLGSSGQKMLEMLEKQEELMEAVARTQPPKSASRRHKK